MKKKYYERLIKRILVPEPMEVHLFRCSKTYFQKSLQTSNSLRSRKENELEMTDYYSCSRAYQCRDAPSNTRTLAYKFREEDNCVSK